MSIITTSRNDARLTKSACISPRNVDGSVCVVDNDSHPALEGAAMNSRTLATELLQMDSQAGSTGFNAANQFVSEAG